MSQATNKLGETIRETEESQIAMEVKHGYKQTEVGVIPDDWNPDYIENLAVITTGSKNTQDRIEDGLYPFFVRSQTVERINSYSFEGEAVLTAGDGVGTGKVFHYINGRFDVHQRVYQISNFADRVNGYFFYLYFSTHFYNRIMQMTAKSSVDSVRRNMISRMQVALPPTEAEQRAIATALSDVDGLLGGLDRLIAKKRDLKQAAMQQLLTGQTRLPGFRANWIVTDFDSLCRSFTKQTGFDYSASIKRSLTFEDKEDSLPFIQNKDFSGIWTNYDTDYFIPESVALNFPRILLDERCFLISISGRVGNVGVFSNKRRAFVGGAVAVAKFKDARHLDWVMFYLQSNEGQNKLLSNVKAGSHQNLILEDLRKIEIPLPPLEEQTAIAEVLTDMDGELAGLEQRREKTRALKQAMMQELLTGKNRLV